VHKTSRDAYDSIKPHLNELQRAVLAYFNLAGARGMTSEELHVFFAGYKETSSRTRISELVEMGLVKDSGTKRPSSSGRAMIVWMAVPKPPKQEDLFS
jgi:hypothetical protein